MTKLDDKVNELANLTDAYMQNIANLFPKDEEIEKVLSRIELGSKDKELFDSLDLDLFYKVAFVSILGYL